MEAELTVEMPHPIQIPLSLMLRRVTLAWSIMVTAAAAAPINIVPGPQLGDPVVLGERVVVDYDSDGLPDVAGIDPWARQLTVIRRLETGRYATPDRIEDLADPHGNLVAGDVNGDGIDDLICQDGSQVRWWMGASGAPHSDQGQLFALEETRIELFGGRDLDGNGLPDLVFGGVPRVENFMSVRALPEVWFQTTPGQFQRTTVTIEDLPFAAPLGFTDADGDGGAELVIGYYGLPIVVDFSIPGSYESTTVRSGGTLGDYNGDGKVDTFQVAEGATDGTLQLQIVHSAALPDPPDPIPAITVDQIPSFNRWIVQGDFDGDSASEILVLDQNLTGSPPRDFGSVRVIDWDGSAYQVGPIFKVSSIDPYQLLSQAARFEAMDLDDDGIDELVVVDAVQSIYAGGFVGQFREGNHFILSPRQTAPGSATWFITSPPVSLTRNHFPVSIKRLDANYDGTPDLISLGGADRQLRGWKAHPDHSFESKGAFSSFPSGAGHHLVVDDFTGRGLPVELAYSHRHAPAAGTWESQLTLGRPYFDDGIALGNSSREGTRTGIFAGTVLGSGDFDGDEKPDLLTVDHTFGRLSWRRNMGTDGYRRLLLEPNETIAQAGLTQSNQGIIEPVDQHQVLIHDIDADGDPDILTYPSAFGNIVGLHRNSGTGTFTLESLPIAPEGLPEGLILADLAGDGTPDIVAISRPWWNPSTILTVGADLGTGTVSETRSDYPAGPAAAGDLDGDGRDEIYTGGEFLDNSFIAGRGGYPLLRYHADPQGRLMTPVVLDAFAEPATDILISDANADNRPDLFVASELGGTVSIYYNEAAAVTPSFAGWAAARGLATDSMGQDPDRDGRNNLAEFAAGTDPLQSDLGGASTGVPGAPPSFAINKIITGQSTITMRHPRPKELASGTLVVVLEVSEDFQDWQPVEYQPSVTWDPAHPDWEILEWQRELRLPSHWGTDLDPPAAGYRFRTIHTP